MSALLEIETKAGVTFEYDLDGMPVFGIGARALRSQERMAERQSGRPIQAEAHQRVSVEEALAKLTNPEAQIVASVIARLATLEALRPNPDN